jgi:hypothetical protein
MGSSFKTVAGSVVVAITGNPSLLALEFGALKIQGKLLIWLFLLLAIAALPVEYDLITTD